MFVSMMQSVSAFLVLILFLSVLEKVCTYMCNNTEVQNLPPEDSSHEFNCICDILSTNCSWSPFADRSIILSSGISESLFVWQRSHGYGQYICVEDNSIVVKNVLILPQGELK